MKKTKIELFDKNGRLTNEAIENAKNVSIIDYLQSTGYAVQKEGANYYSLSDHNSFKINTKKNTYYWNSRHRGGNAITLLTDEELYNMDYRSAVIELNKEENERIKGDYSPFNAEGQKEEYKFPKAEMTDREPEKAISYLVNERKIDKDLINTLVAKRMIRQDQKNNVVYPWAKDGEIVGHNAEGTYKKEDGNRYKHIAANGNQSYGFSFQTGKGEMKNHFYFESEVDALSYVTLNGLTPQSKYMSMRGVNNQALVNRSIGEAVEKYDRVPNLVFCVDNDEAGKTFNDLQIKRELSYKGERVNLYFAVPEEKEGIKDWNDVLKNRDGRPYESYEKTILQNEKSYINNRYEQSIDFEMEK